MQFSGFVLIADLHLDVYFQGHPSWLKVCHRYNQINEEWLYLAKKLQHNSHNLHNLTSTKHLLSIFIHVRVYSMGTRACCHEAIFSKTLAGVFFLVPFYVQKWHKKFEKSWSTFSWLETGLKFWPLLEGKTENMRFSRIGLILARKWKCMNQMSTQPFWGVFCEVFELRS